MMGRSPRQEYETEEFRQAWFDLSRTVAEIGAAYGVSKVSIWRAAKRRDWPHRRMINQQKGQIK
jgi:hypothetical protein